ncbi:MAG: Nramp family divalent metal transporter [Candidatus Aenigmarchaeota archaeon]|nr:Nramp family divalent metal transporter [Candidatus Aenigmarchaeota archaeon]
MKFPKLDKKKLIIFLGIIGPGLITANVDNDAGGITTYSVAGAQFGYPILWTLIPITILLIIVQEMCARMGAVTGKGLSDLIRENFGVKVTFFIMVGLLVANFATTVSEFAGIAAAGEIFGLSRFILVPLCAITVALLLLKFNYKSLEKIFLLMILFYVSYIISGVMANPDWGEVGRQLITPTFQLSSAYIIILVGLIGTTIAPWMQFYLQSSIVEKGINAKDYAYSKVEVMLGCVMTDVVSFFIIVCCAALLFTNGIVINNAADAAIALEPLAGTLAKALFAVGLFGAGLFGAFILPLATAFYVCEAFGWESGLNRKFGEAKHFYTIIGAIIAFSVGVILLPDLPLVWIMLLSQVVNGVVLPIILVAVVKLINNEHIMGEYTNSRFYNVVVTASTVILILLSGLLVVTTFWPNILG